MKILLTNNHFSNYGGADTYTYHTGKLLRENGHEIFFFASNRGIFFDENYEYSRYFPQYVSYRSLSKHQLIGNVFKPFYNFEAKTKLNQYIKEIKPDIVHCNCISYHLTPSILDSCYENNIPIIMTLHDARFLCPAGPLMRGTETYCQDELCIKGNPIHCLINKCKYKSLPASALATFEYFFNRALKIFNKVSMFICPSNALLELAVRSGIPREKLILINNFIDDSYFNIQPEYKDGEYFLYAGRLVKEKGVHHLLDAMAKLPDIKLHIVGNGLEEDNLKKQAENLNLDVEFVGFKSGQELENEYKNCIASILPSNYFEIFGLSIIESFAYGKPVIASNIGAIPEIIENDKNGILFKPGNADSIANAIKKLHSNNDLIHKMGLSGRIKAELLYTQSTHYSKLIDAYRKIV